MEVVREVRHYLYRDSKLAHALTSNRSATGYLVIISASMSTFKLSQTTSQVLVLFSQFAEQFCILKIQIIVGLCSLVKHLSLYIHITGFWRYCFSLLASA